MGKERKTDRRYAGGENDGAPELSDAELERLRKETRSQRPASPMRVLPDGRKVLDIGLVPLYDEVPTLSTPYEVLSGKGERHSKGFLQFPLDKII